MLNNLHKKAEPMKNKYNNPKKNNKDNLQDIIITNSLTLKNKENNIQINNAIDANNINNNPDAD